LQHTKTEKYTQIPQNIPMAIKYTNWPQIRPNSNKIYKCLPLQGPPKFTQFGILGLKIYVPSSNPGFYSISVDFFAAVNDHPGAFFLWSLAAVG
jgi:hypothetical protein